MEEHRLVECPFCGTESHDPQGHDVCPDCGFNPGDGTAI